MCEMIRPLSIIVMHPGGRIYTLQYGLGPSQSLFSVFTGLKIDYS
jgi:hypothetical protein